MLSSPLKLKKVFIMKDNKRIPFKQYIVLCIFKGRLKISSEAERLKILEDRNEDLKSSDIRLEYIKGKLFAYKGDDLIFKI